MELWHSPGSPQLPAGSGSGDVPFGVKDPLCLTPNCPGIPGLVSCCSWSTQTAGSSSLGCGQPAGTLWGPGEQGHRDTAPVLSQGSRDTAQLLSCPRGAATQGQVLSCARGAGTAQLRPCPRGAVTPAQLLSCPKGAETGPVLSQGSRDSSGPVSGEQGHRDGSCPVPGEQGHRDSPCPVPGEQGQLSSAQALLPPWGLSWCFPQEQLLFQLQTFASFPGSLEQREFLSKFLPCCRLRSKLPVLVSNSICPCP